MIFQQRFVSMNIDIWSNWLEYQLIKIVWLEVYDPWKIKYPQFYFATHKEQSTANFFLTPFFFHISELYDKLVKM